MAASRIDDLRRRVEADPASIAFAQLAEEYRRSGQTEEAVRVCREGLTRHPGYLSARVTLGRALLDLGQLDDAREELQFVAGEAPENLAAVRGLAEILHREGDLPQALEYYRRALALARHDPELEELVQQLSRQVGAESSSSNGLSFEEAHQELLSAGERVPLVTPSTGDASIMGSTAPFDFDTLVAALGTPSAPRHVEAVAAGESVPATQPTVAELPRAGDPFAALEEELRARDAVVPDQTARAPELPPEHIDPESTVQHESLVARDAESDAHPTAASEPDEGTPPPAHGADVALADSADEVPQFIEVSEPSVAEPLPWQDQVSDGAMKPWPWEPVAATADDATTDFLAETAADVSPVPAPEAAAPDAPAPPTVTEGDDVLGDLEGWLDTLQSRAGQ